MFLHKKGVKSLFLNILFTHSMLHVLLFFLIYCFLIIWNLQSIINLSILSIVTYIFVLGMLNVLTNNKYEFEEARKCPKDNKYVIFGLNNSLKKW